MSVEPCVDFHRNLGQMFRIGQVSAPRQSMISYSSWQAISLWRWAVVSKLPFFGCRFHRYMASNLSSMAKVGQQYLYKRAIIIWNETDVNVIRGALYNEQHFVNYDDIWLFLRVAQIVSMYGHAMSYLNWDWISPCITSSWLVDASCYFCASRVSTLTSTSCTLLYVQLSTTFSGGRCNDFDSSWCMLASYPRAVQVIPWMM